MLFLILAAGQLGVLALSPFLLIIGRGRSAAYGAWLAGTSAAVAALAFVQLNIMDTWASLGGINPASWNLTAGVLTLIEIMAFRRFFSSRALTLAQQRRGSLISQRKAIETALVDLAHLKTSLEAEEGRLRESFKFYSTVRELAESVDFEQMKRVLENSLRVSMPYISGFALIVLNDETGRLEPQVQHRLWLNSEWIEKILTADLEAREKSFFIKDPTGRDLITASVKSNRETLGLFVGAVDFREAQGQIGPDRQEVLALAATLAEELKFGLLKAKSFAKVEKLSRMDGLTGLFRRGMFDLRLAEELARARTFKTNLGLLLLDIDYFKSLNDRWGHPFGDLVLRRASGLIRAGVYETDFVARYGGEEFAVLLPRANEEGARRKAEKIRQGLETEVFYYEDKKAEVRCTISIGLAFFPRDAKDGEGLIHSADQALYQSKKAGRNRVTSKSEIH